MGQKTVVLDQKSGENDLILTEIDILMILAVLSQKRRFELKTVVLD